MDSSSDVRHFLLICVCVFFGCWFIRVALYECRAYANKERKHQELIRELRKAQELDIKTSMDAIAPPKLVTMV